MPLIPVKVPLVVKKMFPKYIWDIPTNDKTIYLTFDDGPTPEVTDWTLKKLAEYQAQATFFCIGNNIEKHPDIFKAILKDGHAIGNHTHHHLKGWKTKTEPYLEDVARTQNLINDLLNQEQGLKPRSQKLFRPPYGRIKNSQGKKLIALGYKIIMWDIISFDWDREISEEKCLDHVLSNAVPGSIIVFHDSVKAAKNMQYALPKVLEYYTKQGFSFKALNF
ncbi:polysaccharide deacetylase family protein [Tamlana sp. s12]|uniref:polysaccharide deacetylase family protein n=1 Tax=Tamlana sp. s12 TaxID=1630406 RepID=UPI0007FFCE4E|nr:polysaccharide deacetylase family protein [Tamlana sp. s12]OBQ57047.1 polysaccharide deacetylase [Tamlana sp. s12]QQY82774.1 polysaccharide deacetylase family protein [Tamlana sp. s12]